MSEFQSNPVHEQELETPLHPEVTGEPGSSEASEGFQEAAPAPADEDQSSADPVAVPVDAEAAPPPVDDAEFAPPTETPVTPDGTAVAPTPEAAAVISKKPGTGLVAAIMGVLQSLAITVAIAVFVITFIVQAFQIPSQSMESTLLVGDYLLVDKVHYGPGGFWGGLEPYKPIHHGDIIVFKFPVNPTQHFVKRVIGVPGDRVRLINKRVFVNGKMLTEPYVTYSRPFSEYQDNFPALGAYDPNMEAAWGIQMRKLVEGRELIVPEDNYFVLGDNRDQSLDSRFWGFVPRENVVGRPLLIYFSMRRPLEVTTPLSSFSDKLHDLTYNLTDLSGRIRWRRAFRLIK